MSKKIEAFWKDATAEYVARVMRGEKVEARFRDYDDADWTEFDLLGGFATSIKHAVSWFDVCGVRWFQCQVYDPPQWWLDKPDPGPGWRLLGKFPDEPKLGTDEALQYDGTTWNRVRMDSGVQDPGVWYRRRIEPNPTRCIGRFCSLAKSTGVFCPHDSCDIETGVRIANNPEIPDSCERQKLEAGKEYLLPSGMVLIVSSERI
jgi:hypothetical protein